MRLEVGDLCRCWVVFSAVLAGGTPVYTNSVIRWHRLVSVWVPLAAVIGRMATRQTNTKSHLWKTTDFALEWLFCW